VDRGDVATAAAEVLGPWEACSIVEGSVAAVAGEDVLGVGSIVQQLGDRRKIRSRTVVDVP
jgi:hypothetical protein